MSVQQNQGAVTPPVGFANYLGLTSLAATSVGASDYYFITQKIEGYNIADLGFGTGSAKTVTLSFWVQSSLTGTFGGALTNEVDASYPFSYTISSANTWEQKTITVAGATIGTWLKTNGVGLGVRFGLGIGSTYSGTAGSWSSSLYTSVTGATSVVGTNGATFYITGVQLEVGSSATGFEYRQYQQELALCQRYCYNLKSSFSNYTYFGSGTAVSSTNTLVFVSFPVTMRASPSATYSAGNTFVVQGASPVTGSGVTSNTLTPFGGTTEYSVASGLTAGWGIVIYANGTSSAYTLYSAEL